MQLAEPNGLIGALDFACESGFNLFE